MKYRVYTETNWSDRMGCYFATYFYRKKDAVAYAETLSEPATIQRKIGDSWVSY